jgi:putative copper resistance protein D
LVPLGFVLLGHAGPAAGPDADWRGLDINGVLMRFSGMGYAAVATLIATGLVNSWVLVGSVSSLIQSTYGQLLMAKFAFFAAMLALAVANRFWLIPVLAAAGSSESRRSEVWRSRLRNHVLAEQSLGLLVLLLVSILGTIRPAIGQ